jgi:hypothetical protein
MRSPIPPSVDKGFITVASKYRELTMHPNATVKRTHEEVMYNAIGTATIKPGFIWKMCMSYSDAASSSL